MFDHYFHLISTLVFLACPSKKKQSLYITKLFVLGKKKISQPYVRNVNKLCEWGTWAGMFSSCLISILIFYSEKQEQVWTSKLKIFANHPCSNTVVRGPFIFSQLKKWVFSSITWKSTTLKNRLSCRKKIQAFSWTSLVTDYFLVRLVVAIASLSVKTVKTFFLFFFIVGGR
jgi:hypothetical protein